MDREIKFRAWDKKREKIYYGDPEKDGEYEVELFNGRVGMVNGNLRHPPHYVWMQFTSSQDKDENDIYEGDIVEIKVSAPWNNKEPIYLNGIITWERQGFWVKTFKHTPDFSDQLGYFGPEQLEIVGNKFENPELLPDKE